MLTLILVVVGAVAGGFVGYNFTKIVEKAKSLCK